MLNWFFGPWFSRLFGSGDMPAPARPTNTLTAADVERAIEEAGRAAVFERAAMLGWTGPNVPPMWVWYSIANDLKFERLEREAKANSRVLH